MQSKAQAAHNTAASRAFEADTHGGGIGTLGLASGTHDQPVRTPAPTPAPAAPAPELTPDAVVPVTSPPSTTRVSSLTSTATRTGTGSTGTQATLTDVEASAVAHASIVAAVAAASAAAAAADAAVPIAATHIAVAPTAPAYTADTAGLHSVNVVPNMYNTSCSQPYASISSASPSSTTSSKSTLMEQLLSVPGMNASTLMQCLAMSGLNTFGNDSTSPPSSVTTLSSSSRGSSITNKTHSANSHSASTPCKQIFPPLPSSTAVSRVPHPQHQSSGLLPATAPQLQDVQVNGASTPLILGNSSSVSVSGSGPGSGGGDTECQEPKSRATARLWWNKHKTLKKKVDQVLRQELDRFATTHPGAIDRLHRAAKLSTSVRTCSLLKVGWDGETCTGCMELQRDRPVFGVHVWCLYVMNRQLYN